MISIHNLRTHFTRPIYMIHTMSTTIIMLSRSTYPLFKVNSQIILMNLFMIQFRKQRRSTPTTKFRSTMRFIRHPTIINSIFRRIITRSRISQVINRQGLLRIRIRINRQTFRINNSMLSQVPLRVKFRITRSTSFKHSIRHTKGAHRRINLAHRMRPRRTITFRQRTFKARHINP